MPSSILKHLVLLLCSFACLQSSWVHAAEPTAKQRGELLYKKLCVECHGQKGEGVTEVNENPLHGSRTINDLIKVIEETMPEEDPELCQGEDAKLVSQYIYDAFYSPQSRSQQTKSRVELSRLTVMQYLNTTMDLLGPGTGPTKLDDRQGLSAEYFNSRSSSTKNRVLTQVDPQISFDFGEGVPTPKIKKAEEFSIRWQGSVLAEETGEYEIILTSVNGVRLWLNNTRQREALIDAKVSSNNKEVEHKVTLRLLGGRPYPLTLELFKYKEKLSSVKLEWIPPHRAREVIPARNFNPRRVQDCFVSSVVFPADESVSGYQRGNSVSQAWDEATTKAAIEIANYVVDKLDEYTKTKRTDKNRAEKSKEFCTKLAEKAFRRPLSNEEKDFFINSQFNDQTIVEHSVKRSVLLCLKSPRFLYPNIQNEKLDDYDIASRLALGLWDSMPNDQLLQDASKKRWQDPRQVELQARRMVKDPRTKAKLRDFFHHWLQLNEKESLVKDETLFPEFTPQTVADLRTSLNLFLDDVVWGDKSDFRSLLQTDSIYLNDHLAQLYNVELPEGSGFRKVSFEKDFRAGVVTHPYLMSTLAYHDLSSPIHRGVFVTRRLLGRTLKPPPQATEFKSADFKHGMTTREKVALITEPAACQGCHLIINPLGFSLEQFDAIGRYREKEENKLINTTSDYSTVTGDTIQLTGARDLANYIARSPQAHGAFVDHLFHHLAKQPINAFGDKTRDELIASFQKNNFNIQQLLVDCMTVIALHDINSENQNDSQK